MRAKDACVGALNRILDAVGVLPVEGAHPWDYEVLLPDGQNIGGAIVDHDKKRVILVPVPEEGLLEMGNPRWLAGLNPRQQVVAIVPGATSIDTYVEGVK